MTTTSPNNPDLLVCVACGTEFDQPADQPLENCVICDVSYPNRSFPSTSLAKQAPPSQLKLATQTNPSNHTHINHQLTNPQDPRQYVPPSGQTWTSRSQISLNHTNTFTPLDTSNANCKLWSITTTPKFAIGQRAVLILSPHGNVLWDCLTLLDDATIALIKAQGGLEAIVISHPHYYTSHLAWASVFGCKVYLSGEDEGWVQRVDHWGLRRLLPTESTVIV
jgi:hypothetical protein